MAAVDVLMRPLKKQKLGPPDCYPQHPKQTEDDLSESRLKRGFINNLVVSHELGSAKELFTQVPLSKFAVQYNGILLQKQKINTFQDGSKKKVQINPKENFWMVTARSRSQVSQWLQDLAGNKSLYLLGKKVPIFNKKEEIFSSLAEYGIPMFRAAWFMKITSAYHNAISEGKMKKKTNLDMPQEWTNALTKFLKEQLSKLVEFYNQPYSNMSMQRPPPEVETAIKQWEYGVRLSGWLFEDGLLEKQTFLGWVIDSIEKLKNNDEALLKHVLPLTLKHLDVIVQTQSLSRILATVAIKKLLMLNSSAEQMQSQKEQNQPGTPMDQNSQTTGGPSSVNTVDSTSIRSESPVLPALTEFKSCQQHKSIVIILCGILQAITLKCPTALIWRNIKLNPGTQISEVKASAFKGSPLDLLPCAPSGLLSCFLSNDDASQDDDLQMHADLQESELEIQRRSQAVERKWLSPAHEETKFVNNKLSLLEMLDKTNFNKTGCGSSVDVLYQKLFEADPHDVTENVVDEDKSILVLLLNWALSKHRHGKYRAVVVAKMFAKRQFEILNEADRRKKENPDDDLLLELGSHPYQNMLLDYLDREAPLPENTQNPLQDETFELQVLLFGELIRHEVFSHDAYLCTLIRRGDMGANSSRHSKKGNLDLRGSLSRDQADTGILGLDSDLLRHKPQIHQLLEQDKHLMEDRFVSSPDFSPAPSEHGDTRDSLGDIKNTTSDDAMNEKRRCQAHTLFVTHFPIPNMDFEDLHEENQRNILLYGVGDQRNKVCHKVYTVERMMFELIREVEEISILMNEYESRLSKSELKRRKAHEEKKIRFYGKFSQLSRFDQFNISSKCMGVLNHLKMTRPSEYGICSALPSVRQLSLLIDLLELSNDVQGLVDLVTEFVFPREVGYVGVFTPQTSSVKGTIPTKLTLIEALIRKYMVVILTSAEQTTTVFKGLLQTVENIADPGVCSSTERCILSTLYDLYVTCDHLKDRCSDIFSTACTKIKQSVRADTMPSNTSLLWETSVLKDYLSAPRNMQLDPIWQRLLSEDRPADLYSFVCNAILSVCNCKDPDRLYDISVLCAEVAAHIGALSSEWLGVLKALCCTSMHGLGFDDLQGTVDVNDSNLQDSLSTFCCILVARCVFSMEDCLRHIIIPSLSAALPTSLDHKNARAGARLACHTLLKLLDASTDHLTSSHGFISSSPFKCTPEHALLNGSYFHISFEVLVYVLKLLLMLTDNGPSSKAGSMHHDPDENDEVFDMLFNQSGLSDPASKSEALFEQSFGHGDHSSSNADLPLSLSSLAAFVLQVICVKAWMQQRFVQEANKLISKEMLLDAKLSISKARRLIALCSTTDGDSSMSVMCNENQQSATNRIFNNLDHWSLDIASLELQLMIRQASKEEVSVLFNAIARSVMSALLADGSSDASCNDMENPKLQLVGPLIGKLSSTVQGRILKTAGEIMEKGKWWKKSEDLRLSPASQQTLFNLILSCLKEQDENKVAFLGSLQKQFTNLILAPDEEKFPINTEARHFLLEGLHLRMNLVGALFDVLQRNNHIIGDWVQTLFQLLASGIIEEDTVDKYKSMFTDLIDMVSVLLATIQLTETSGPTHSVIGNDSQKYGILVRRMMKELTNKEDTPEIFQCRQLLPLETSGHEVLCMEPVNVPDNSQNGSSTPLNKDKANDIEHTQQGLKDQGVQYVNSWDMLEDHKNPAPLSLAWFGAVRMDRRPSKHLDQAKQLVHHNHQRRRPLSYYTHYELDDDDDDDDDDEEDHEMKDLVQSNQSVSPNTPGGPPTPGNKSALAQLLASVQSTGEARPSGESARQIKQTLQHQQQQPIAAKRKRGMQRQGSQQGLPGTQTLTPAQQKKLQLLMQQQQPQQGSMSSGQIVLGQQPLVGGQGRQNINMVSTPDSTKEALQAMLSARNQQSSSVTQGSQVSSHTSHDPIAQLQQQIALHKQQQQKQLQLQQQQQQQQQQYGMPQEQVQMTSQKQSVRMMSSQVPPNVQLPPNQAMSISSNQGNLMYSNQPTQSLSTFSQGSQLPQYSSQNVQSQQMTQYSSTNQSLVPSSQIDDTQSTLQQLLQIPLSRSTISPVQQLRLQSSQNRSFYQQQQLASLRQQQQQQSQQQQQQRPSQAAIMNQLKRQYKGLQQQNMFQRQFSDPASAARQMQDPSALQQQQQSQQQQQQPDLSMFQRQLSEPQGSLQQLQNMLPPRSSQFLGNTQQYPPSGPY